MSQCLPDASDALADRLVHRANGHAFYSVLAMVQARLDAVGPEARRTLRATHGDTARWLAELVAREMIVAANDTRVVGEAQYRFRHALVRDAAYASFTDADRAIAHRRAGE